MLCSLVYSRLSPSFRSCARWSRTMQPENRGWPSSWSRWWPSWAWRAEDRISQDALGRDPIRNRAVPEQRPVPIFFIMWLPPLSFLETSSFTLFLLPLWRDLSPLIHSAAKTRLPEYGRGGLQLRLVPPTVQSGASLSCTTGSDCLRSWPYWHSSFPSWKREETFYVAFKNLHSNFLKTTTLGVHLLNFRVSSWDENSFQAFGFQ